MSNAWTMQCRLKDGANCEHKERDEKRAACECVQFIPARFISQTENSTVLKQPRPEWEEKDKKYTILFLILTENFHNSQAGFNAEEQTHLSCVELQQLQKIQRHPFGNL